MINDQYKYSELTSKIIACAMTVHKALGNGVQEVINFAQAINYLEAYNLEIGLLINFGEKSLNFKRLTNKKYKQ